MVQTVGLDLPANHLASLDLIDRHLFVLRSGISCGGSSLAFRERHVVRHLSILCARVWHPGLDSLAYFLEGLTAGSLFESLSLGQVLGSFCHCQPTGPLHG